MTTDYHVKLFAHELLRRYPSDNVERFTATLMDSQVDLKPHQVDAALFAFRSPLSKGAILADEVGLGKTIEAGIVLAQKWAERKRKILIILPSSLRKQWNQELLDKFYLPSQILEASNFNKAVKQGVKNPFDMDVIVLCSYPFARNKSSFVRAVPWDLVVIDEAHRLRNVYKNGNKIARELKSALDHAPKLLLTATPLQNSLLELFGLVSFIDNHTFGDLKSFRNRFARLSNDDNFDDLKQRLQPVCKRTLRRQVLEYIRYTERKAYTQEFVPSPEEEALYDMVTDYLRRPDLQALPTSQRTLMTLVLRKLLASSTFAIAGAIDSLANKLEKRLKDNDVFSNKYRKTSLDIESDFEAFQEYADELGDVEDVFEPLTEDEKELIENEISDLRAFHDLAMQITNNAKGVSLLTGLRIGFEMATTLGGSEKAIIFTESRRTQNYLITLLSENGYADDIVLFNGSNDDTKSRDIYRAWKQRYQATDRVSGSRTADTRAALVDYFKTSAKIMIATEAAAEGLNLQFCSLVVNYDLPWNPQRIEQRIGRCHRYGQIHDVVVVNFLNKNNEADQRVYQLLSEKFKLFHGVFGASDDVLGCIESGVDFEKRIAGIYQTCRSSEDIRASFDALQKELETKIQGQMQSTRQKLLDNFDTEVAEKLNVYKAKTMESLNRYEALLWDTTCYVLKDHAFFYEKDLTFDVHTPYSSIVPTTGKYTLKRNDDLGHHYRLNHPLAQGVLAKAANLSLPHAELVFNYTLSGKTISILKELVGQRGLLNVSKLTVNTVEAEDYILCIAITEHGKKLDSEQSRRLFNLPADIRLLNDKKYNSEIIDGLLKQRTHSILADISERNSKFFEEEIDKLDRWANDQKQSLEYQISETDHLIKQFKTDSRKAVSLEEKLVMQRKIKNFESKRTDMRRRLFEAQDDIDLKKEALLDKVEARLKQTAKESVLFTVKWRII